MSLFTLKLLLFATRIYFAKVRKWSFAIWDTLILSTDCSHVIAPSPVVLYYITTVGLQDVQKKNRPPHVHDLRLKARFTATRHQQFVGDWLWPFLAIDSDFLFSSTIITNKTKIIYCKIKQLLAAPQKVCSRWIGW